MKVCDSWLREWCEHGVAPVELGERLTLLGLEVEGVASAGAALAGVVVGQVVTAARHPDARKLTLCEVDAGDRRVNVVCGAANVRAGGRYPLALPGAELPGGMRIEATTIRGAPSAGMLCSGAELGLDGQGEGLLELDAAATPGAPVTPLLALGEAVYDISITPNRADCFSVAGIAREAAAATGRAFSPPSVAAVPASAAAVFPVRIEATADCSRFAARVIRGLRPAAATPLWMRERLRRCGVRAIHPVVDVTNYVMLELGQPLHAYDLERLSGELTARRGRAGERLALLDGREVTVDPNVLVIADGQGAVGLAGVMGGQRTAVSATTNAIVLESAAFSREAIAGRARRYGLTTDAAVRFERGVSPDLQARAIERATALVLAIAGGEPGPLIDTVLAGHLQTRPPVRLRRERLAKVLGTSIPAEQVVSVLQQVGMTTTGESGGWLVQPPPQRFDIEREEDLIEEVARLVGYDRMPSSPGLAPTALAAAAEVAAPERLLVAALVARGYQEAITYSFVAPAESRLFGAVECAALALSNPIAADLAVMRQSLWPGLVQAARANLARQQERVRLFECGTVFLPAGEDGHREERAVAFVAVGSRQPTQWGLAAQAADFHDAKGDVELLLALGGCAGSLRFVAAEHPALHPGRSARLESSAGATIGWLGELHPAVARALDVPPLLLFEAALAPLVAKARPVYTAVSRFPAVRRDLAVVVARDLPVADILACARSAAPSGLQQAFVFDIYTGRQMAAGEKSVAIGLILQDTSRTLTDGDADHILGKISGALSRDLQARIRE
jgi:phenylalanyl-tRNA synthetase beta chain